MGLPGALGALVVCKLVGRLSKRDDLVGYIDGCLSGGSDFLGLLSAFSALGLLGHCVRVGPYVTGQKHTYSTSATGSASSTSAGSTTATAAG